jgi:EmrB/QacA subfamily drug resistance transporter
VAGLVVFTVASLINGLATSSGMLVGGRALQGLGAALVSPAALSIVTTTFAEGAERTKALGIWSAIAAGGGAVGLVLGGLLTETLSWRWVFFINLPIGIAAALLSLRYVANSRAEKRPDTADVAGAVTVTSGLLVLVYAIVKAQDYGWTSAKTLGLGALAAVLLGSFVVIELRSKAPLIRLGIFRLRSLTASNVAMLLVASGLFSMFYFAGIYLQEVLNYGPLKAGLAFLPFTLGIIVGAVASQQLIQRIGIRAVVFVGLTLGAVGLLYFTQLSTTSTYLANVFPAIAVMSIGMGMTFVPLTLLATTKVDADDAGLASGLFNTSQQIGGALGLAVLSTLATSRTSDLIGSGVAQPTAITNGFHVAFAVGAGLLLAGIAVIAIFIRSEDVTQIDAAEVAVPA